jgi:predicted Rossmann fold flavoprotein
MDKYDLIVVGGGASGLMASGIAAQNGAKVLLLEKMFRPGRKLRITGKGRCNLTNLTSIDNFLDHVNNPDFLKPAFNEFFVEDLISFFNSVKIKTKIERGRRVFPQSDKAQDVVDGLEKWIIKSGVTIKKNIRVNKLFTKEGSASGIRSNKGKMFFANKILLCTGGLSYPATGSTGDGYNLAKLAGHTITTTQPSLVPITVSGNIPSKLDKLSLRNISIKVYRKKKMLAEKFGEMQFLSYGLSGPLILSLSREFNKELTSGKPLDLSIDLKPVLSEIQIENRIKREVEKLRNLDLKSLLRKLLPSQLVNIFIDLLNIDAQKLVSKLNPFEIKEIILLLKDFRFQTTGLRDFKEAIITSGGVNLYEVNSKTMESKKLKNLYIAGELLDLDADTGGYNLQIAFSTGWLAAMAATKK